MQVDRSCIRKEPRSALGVSGWRAYVDVGTGVKSGPHCGSLWSCDRFGSP